MSWNAHHNQLPTMPKRSKDGMKGGQAKRVKMSAKPISITKTVQRILNKRVERKENTVYQAPFTTTLPVTTTGSVVNLNEIAEGTDFNNRIGRHIRMWNVDVDYVINLAVPATGNDAGFVGLVLDRESVGSGAGFNQIFDLTGGQVAGQAFKNTTQWDKRFKLLWIDNFALGQGGPTTLKGRHFFKFAEQGSDADVEYASSGGTTVPNSNALYFVYGSATNGCQIGYNAKLKFQDM